MSAGENGKGKVLMLSSVASMIDQFNMPNIRLLQEMGYEVHVACNFKEGNTCDRQQIGRMCKALKNSGVVGHQWDCPRTIYSVEKCHRAYAQLVRLLQRQQFDWIHCHSPVGGALARIAAHKKGIPVIYTAHGFHFYHGAPLKNWVLYYPVEAALAHWTDILITVNQEDYHFAKKYLKAKKVVRVHGVGIDVGKFQKPLKQNIRRQYRIPEEAHLLLSVGELSKRKNHRIVIDALSGLKNKNVYYLICGQGALKKAHMRQAEKLGVAKQIRMTGFQKNVADMYHNADIFVFPSGQEGMPVALMEAMAAGMPCVVSDIRGNRELIDSNGGIRFSLKQKVQLQEALTQLLENKQLRLKYGSYNRQKINAYDAQRVLPNMKKIYMWMQAKQSHGKQVLHVLKSGHFAGAEHVALTICQNSRKAFQTAYASEQGEIHQWLEKDGIPYFPMKKLSLKELNAIISVYRPDIVHAHDFTASVLCALIKRKYLLFSHLHNNPLWIRRWNIRTICYQAMKKRMDAILLVSDAIRQEAVFLKAHKNKDKNKVVVVGNPVDVGQIKFLSQEIVTDAAELLFVGRLTGQKAPETFLRVVYRLCRTGMPVHAVMLGDGELFETCRAELAELGLTDIVRMKGFVSNPYPYMKQAKLLLMPSVWEGYGLAAAEALAVGTPVLVSPVGGLKERFRNFPQALCSSEKEFAEKAAMLLKNQKLYEQYRLEMMQKVSIGELDAYMRNIHKIYEEVNIW